MTVSEKTTAQGQKYESRWIVLLLGLNAWLVVDLWPVVFSENPQAWENYLLPLSPVLLLFANHGMPRQRTAAKWILLALFPINLLIPVALRSEIDNQLAFTPLVLLFAALSLTVYVALTAEAVSRSVRYRQCDYKPLALSDASPIQPTRVHLRRTIVAFALSGAACIAATAPSFGGFQELRRYWGNAFMQAGLLVTLLSSTLAVAVMLSFLGSVLKAGEGLRRAQSERKRKLISSLILSVFGFLTFYLLQTR